MSMRSGAEGTGLIFLKLYTGMISDFLRMNFDVSRICEMKTEIFKLVAAAKVRAFNVCPADGQIRMAGVETSQTNHYALGLMYSEGAYILLAIRHACRTNAVLGNDFISHHV